MFPLVSSDNPHRHTYDVDVDVVPTRRLLANTSDNRLAKLPASSCRSTGHRYSIPAAADPARSPTPRSKPCAHNFTPRLSPSICVASRRPDARSGRRGSEICWSRELSYQKMTRDWNHLRRRAAILQRLAARAFEVVSSAAAGRELQRSTSVFYLYRFRLLLDGNLSNGDVLTRQTLRGCPDVGLGRGPPPRRPRRSGKPVNDSTPFVVGGIRAQINASHTRRHPIPIRETCFGMSMVIHLILNCQCLRVSPARNNSPLSMFSVESSNCERVQLSTNRPSCPRLPRDCCRRVECHCYPDYRRHVFI